MMGWHHSANCTGLSQHAIHNISGEGVHLAAMSAITSSIFSQPTAVWWERPRQSEVQYVPTLSSNSSASAAPAPKMRRTGGLKVHRSME
jgi:hypothetical protein